MVLLIGDFFGLIWSSWSPELADGGESIGYLLVKKAGRNHVELFWVKSAWANPKGNHS